MDELRSYWQVPSIAHFCYLFKDGLKLPKFGYEDLELAFLTPVASCTETDPDKELNDGSGSDHLLVKLITILLKGYFNNHCISHHNWEQYLKRLFDLLRVGQEGKRSPFLEVRVEENGLKAEKYLTFNELSLRTKVEVVYSLCEYRLYAEDSSNAVANLVEDELRVEPLGRDTKGYVYWYFFGTRLYRENPSSAKSVEQKLANLAKFKSIPRKETTNIKPKEPPKKKPRREPVIGERSSQREKKPVILNGTHTPTTLTSKKAETPKAGKSAEVDPRDPSTSCGVPLAELRESWCVICESESEWVNLTEQYQKSKAGPEAEFYQILAENFLPRISEIFGKKEKEAKLEEKRKLVQFLPRRESTRIQSRKIQRVEDEKREKEEMEERKRKMGEAEERAKRDEERLRRERVKEDREVRSQQRLEIMERRASRVARREKNPEEGEREGEENNSDNSSDSFNAHLDIEETTTSSVQSAVNGWHINDTVDVEISKEQLHDALCKIISSVLSNRDAWPFKEPVDEKTAPMYYLAIEEPIDLSTIERKIKEKLYLTFYEVEQDFKLMVRNCETYNGPKNGYTLMAYAVWKAFRKATKRHLNRDLTEDEQTVFIYPPKVTNTTPRAAIEARKKKTQKRQRKGMKALDVLAQAAEMAVRDTSSRSSFTASSPRSTLSFDDRANDASIFDEFDFNRNQAVPESGETLTRYLHNSPNVTNSATSGQCYVSSNDNLTFKSLSEWSESIKKSGNSVILPQHAIVVSSSPVSSNFSHY